jgi:GABA(A) receptor-associated protein
MVFGRKKSSLVASEAPFAAAFKQSSCLEQRREQYKRVAEAHPNKIPVIVEKAPNCALPSIPKNKFLVPGELTVAQFANVIRKNIKLGMEEALVLYINGSLQAASAMFSTIYEDLKDPEDGFLYILYTGEASFGSLNNFEW